MTLTGLILLALATLFSVIAQLALKKVSGTVEIDVSRPVAVFRDLLLNGYFWVFGVSAVASAVVWVAVLRNANVNLAFPISNGLGFVLIGVLAFLIFGERLTVLQLLGCVVILAGIVLVTWKP